MVLQGIPGSPVTAGAFGAMLLAPEVADGV